VAFFLCTSATAQITIPPRIHIPRVTAPPRLEDFVSGENLRTGLRITNFHQREPNDGSPARLETVAYLSYDDKNIYAVFLCKEDPKVLRAHVSQREDISDDDRVSITLDTFHDNRRAYEFFSNPLGIQKDGIITEGQDDDFDFDTVWHSQGRITQDGFAVLIAIPFKSLRFDPKPAATWGIVLGRYSPVMQEFSTWPQTTERVEAYIPQFATLEAMNGEKPTHNFQFIPYVSFIGQRAIDTDFGADPSPKTTNEWRGGVDAKYVFHDALTFDFTANPDFSQVESDEPQVTINQRYEVFFPEKRPFFTDGAGFFQTPETLFFSRRIADPQFGLRMTGKIGGWSLGLLTADDRAPGRLAPTDDPMAGARANIQVFRTQREIGKESSVGFLFSRRSFGSVSNDAFSLDTRLKLNDNWWFTAQAVKSGAVDDSGNHLSGADAFAEIRHTGLHWNYSTSYLDRSPNFRADLGFIPRVDIRDLENDGGYQWRPETGPLVSFGPNVNTRLIYDHHGKLQEWAVNAPFSFQFKGPTSISCGRLEELETFQGIGFRESANYISLSSQKFKPIGIDASYTRGTDINFEPADGLLPFLGKSYYATAGITFRPNSQLRIAETYIFDRLRTFAGSAITALPSSAAVYNNHLFRTRVHYQFTRSFSARAIIDYDATLPNSKLINLENSKRITTDFLLTYLLHPGTAIYAGYTDRFENLMFDSQDSSQLQRTNNPTFQTSRQFFVKLSYLLRF
jgi:hypothetical protein